MTDNRLVAPGSRRRRMREVSENTEDSDTTGGNFSELELCCLTHKPCIRPRADRICSRWCRLIRNALGTNTSLRAISQLSPPWYSTASSLPYLQNLCKREFCFHLLTLSPLPPFWRVQLLQGKFLVCCVETGGLEEGRKMGNTLAF